jgi:putative hydrolase of the HAD superfamily
VELEAVTIDAYDTLITLRDPLPALQHALVARGVERTRAQVEDAFAAEVAYYTARNHEGRDEVALALLRRDCARVFLSAAGIELEPDDFAAAFVESLVFEPLPGAVAACEALAAAGLRLAIVSNWDIGLHEHLEKLGLTRLVDTVVTSAEAGAPKPDAAVFLLALARLGVEPGRAVHVGDGPADEEGARGAGLRFEPAPLAAAAQRILGA